ncbi:hypothetical protein D7I44_15155 [Gryllotalpicola protaetiae]|uniref:Lipoprotein n=1 Tax=Gryllotalpicola protaetiae TaxID=2419771 RepID=A0A387BQD1_9MICO|nr:hypothetical protein D7I44_15155 [Gryllotalpicola protaetiae]
MLAFSIGLAGCTADSRDADTGNQESGASKAAQSPTPTPTPTPISLDGTWKQTNSNASDAWQAATISGNTIEIDWITDNGATNSLYWAGSVTQPTTGGDTFTWTSNNDTSRTENALLASSDPTKDFTYDHGVISYSVSALGTTTTVKIARDK